MAAATSISPTIPGYFSANLGNVSAVPDGNLGFEGDLVLLTSPAYHDRAIKFATKEGVRLIKSPRNEGRMFVDAKCLQRPEKLAALIAKTDGFIESDKQVLEQFALLSENSLGGIFIRDEQLASVVREIAEDFAPGEGAALMFAETSEGMKAELKITSELAKELQLESWRSEFEGIVIDNPENDVIMVTANMLMPKREYSCGDVEGMNFIFNVMQGISNADYLGFIEPLAEAYRCSQLQR